MVGHQPMLGDTVSALVAGARAGWPIQPPGSLVHVAREHSRALIRVRRFSRVVAYRGDAASDALRRIRNSTAAFS